MSRYPTSAELAAFRRTFIPPHMVDSMHPSDGGAIKGWPNELRDGIGSRGYLAGASASFDRREASASRSRAYAHGFGSLADRETFAPSPWAAPFLDIPHPIVASDTWTEDGPRSPLPIRYQPSFVITR